MALSLMLLQVIRFCVNAQDTHALKMTYRKCIDYREITVSNGSGARKDFQSR